MTLHGFQQIDLRMLLHDCPLVEAIGTHLSSLLTTPKDTLPATRLEYPNPHSAKPTTSPNPPPFLSESSLFRLA